MIHGAFKQSNILNLLNDKLKLKGYEYVSHSAMTNYDLMINYKHIESGNLFSYMIDLHINDKFYPQYYMDYTKLNKMKKIQKGLDWESKILIIYFLKRDTYLWDITNLKLSTDKYKSKVYLLDLNVAKRIEFTYEAPKPILNTNTNPIEKRVLKSIF